MKAIAALRSKLKEIVRMAAIPPKYERAMASTVLPPGDQPADGRTYRRTYLPAPGWFAFNRVFALGLLTAAGWIAGGLAGYWPIHVRAPADTLAWALLGGGAFAGALYIAGTIHKVRVTLYNDEIEIVSYGTPLSLLSLRPPRRVTRCDIVARAFTHGRGGDDDDAASSKKSDPMPTCMMPDITVTTR